MQRGRIARGRSWRVLQATRRSLQAGSPTWPWWNGQPAHSADANPNLGSPHGRSDPASPRSHADDHGARRHCRGLAPTDVSSADVAGPSASHREIAGGLIEQGSAIEEADRALASTASNHNRLTLITLILQVPVDSLCGRCSAPAHSAILIDVTPADITSSIDYGLCMAAPDSGA